MSLEKLVNPTLLIVDYYDKLVQQIDQFTEQILNDYDKKTLLRQATGTKRQKTANPNNQYADMNAVYFDTDRDPSENFGLQVFDDPYSDKFEYPESQVAIDDSSTLHDHVNMAREQALAEIRQAQSENLKFYQENKKELRVKDMDSKSSTQLEELKCKLFANKFCFLLKNKSQLSLQLISTDFYMNPSDQSFLAELIETGLKMFTGEECLIFRGPAKHVLDARGLFLHLVREFICGVKCVPGVQTIRAIKKTILSVSKVKIESKDVDIRPVPGLDLRDSFFNGSKARWDDLINLQILRIETSNKDRVEVEIDIGKMKSLKWLEIDHLEHLNVLKNINPDLVVLRFHDSKLMDDKKFLEENRFSKLVALEIRNCFSFEPLQEWFSHMASLKHLSFKLVGLKNLDFLETDLLKQLETLILSNCSVRTLKKGECFCKLKSLKRLDLSENHMKNLATNVFRNLPQLETLVLDNMNQYADTKFDRIKRGVFDGLTNLKSLSFANSNLESIDQDAFESLVNLREINLCSNGLTLSSKHFGSLKNLKKVSLKGNKLDQGLIQRIFMSKFLFEIKN